MTAPAKLRELLTTAPSPDPRHDYIVGLEGAVGDAMVTARYVPDRLIVTAEAAAAYFAALDSATLDSAPGAEALALLVLDDFNNELVPRWIEVQVTRDRPLRHWAAVEDRQPGWENPLISARR